MLITGVVGGVGSGKTLVASELGKLGAGVLDGDRAGHEVLKEGEVCRAIRERWGDQVFDRMGHVERRRLAQIVFAPTPTGLTELEYLEQLTHPRILALLEGQILEMRDQGVALAVLDAPVMFKAGWDQLCDKIIFVDVPCPIRLARCRERGWTEEEFARREASQESIEWKRSRADVVIDNSGPPAATRRQVEQFWYNSVPVT